MSPKRSLITQVYSNAIQIVQYNVVQYNPVQVSSIHKNTAYLLFKWSHSWNKKEGAELDGAFHIEVGIDGWVQKFLEGAFEEGVVLLI